MKKRLNKVVFVLSLIGFNVFKFISFFRGGMFYYKWENAILNEESIISNLNCIYGCGIFELTKKHEE